ncbi:MAG TPA: hypothetical protein VFD03_09005 [Clostridia bacterium]|nr:hypothetical protein [Clostridia bacterium]
MGHMTEMMRELTDKLNSIAEKLENETDEDELMTLRIQAGVKIEIMKKLIMAKPIAKYDSENNEAYIVYGDGEKEAVQNKG